MTSLRSSAMRACPHRGVGRMPTPGGRCGHANTVGVLALVFTYLLSAIPGFANTSAALTACTNELLSADVAAPLSKLGWQDEGDSIPLSIRPILVDGIFAASVSSAAADLNVTQGMKSAGGYLGQISIRYRAYGEDGTYLTADDGKSVLFVRDWKSEAGGTGVLCAFGGVGDEATDALVDQLLIKESQDGTHSTIAGVDATTAIRKDNVSAGREAKAEVAIGRFVSNLIPEIDREPRARVGFVSIFVSSIRN